jgi:cyclopropane-fatty-acyl-phospholipid synthase
MLGILVRKGLKIASNLERGSLKIVLPDGQVHVMTGKVPGRYAEITIHDWSVFSDFFREGYLGFCEGYLRGKWDTDDLQSLMDLVYDGNDRLNDALELPGFYKLVERLRFWLQSNSKRQAAKNISYHYDLGNEFYRLWLDETMTYSSAIFENPQESLEAAQKRKYASMVDQMGAVPGDHVLEIGCGWGGFAEYAAGERGLKVTALTISQRQYDFAVERIAKAGLSDRVSIKLQDYRDERGTYDGIASIEMFEAVGERYWPTYFSTLRDCLRPGRHATLQIITVADDRWPLYRRSVDFIQKYIFPGGMLPAPSVLRAEVEKAGLRVKGSIEFGTSYSLTLRRWHETFTDRWGEVKKLGFDDRFKRMWDFYLASCAGAFQGGNCDVTQITVTRPT